MTLLKVLGPRGEAIHGGEADWFLPNGKPGKWMPKVANVRCCSRGYHLVELYSLPEWLRADCTIYLAEGKGPSHTDGSGKTAYTKARLLRQVECSEHDLRLFAADCAEHVLPIFEKNRPGDDRPRKAIEAARKFARGEIGAAARAAAWAAARDAARAAAWAAARDAAGVAAGDAAGDAARDAAGDAAGVAARDAARAAARAAARDAAGVAERQWQASALGAYLGLEL